MLSKFHSLKKLLNPPLVRTPEDISLDRRLIAELSISILLAFGCFLTIYFHTEGSMESGAWFILGAIAKHWLS